ncbi:DUF5134 domain-containing protein [Amycolatopsis sp. DSM 110486]|uniref:DUF5134 domain-containing protein n=1 Tax=Amycolatopsis sp. DSM 110486 TaxID=2865832 RepID=UPI0021036069|nr:DUF5134 domain-containing protein [Amycolatopsis sp. DSM 110486]
MIHDLVLRWVVTALFALCVAERVHGIAVGRLARRGVVGHSLHALMALAMAVMAWPRGADLPTTIPLLLFVSAAVWFVAGAVRTAEHRRADAYHALMMLAMAWMYAVMTDGLLPAPVKVAAVGGHHGSSMPGMHMPGMHMAIVDTTSDTAGTSPLITGLNWLLTIGSTVAGAWWLSELLARRRTKPLASGRAQLAIATQALMAAGMATMFAAMM